LPRFTKAGLRVVIGADDPGIFSTSLAAQETILRTSFGWSEIMLQQSQKLARQSRAESLVRREAI
jgi:adenosine deaminase